MIDTYSFSGNVTTIIGFVGITSTILIVVVAFRRFFNSPYNIRYRPMNRPGKDLDSLDDFVNNENEST